MSQTAQGLCLLKSISKIEISVLLIEPQTKSWSYFSLHRLNTMQGKNFK